MTLNEIYDDAEKRMKSAVETTRKELSHLRAGRANPALLERVQVMAYDTVMPLNQVASISTPDAKTLVVQPFDKGNLASIERGILKSDLGLTPVNDGRIIRLNIPPLTDERRAELTKVVHKMAEEGKVSLRNVRRDANEHIKKLEKDKQISEDERFKALEKTEKLLDKYVEEIDKLSSAKIAEIKG
jgi:ribosome recycling factor